MPRINSAQKKSPSSVTIVPNDKLLVSRREAAQLLSISERAVDYLVSTKRMPSRRIGSRVLIPVVEVRKFARFDHPQPVAG
jgi:excisionase family DNA binding protein